jgi:formate dehydrogenase iron-sulfur subunit
MSDHTEVRVDKNSLTRRAFLRKIGAGVAATMAAQALALRAYPAVASTTVNRNTPAVLIDLTRCIGCNSCALACKESNGLPDPEVVPEGLSSGAYTFVATYDVTTAAGEVETRNVKRQCMHCLEPACVAACPAAAMYKSKEGPIEYRPDRCLGCRYCQIACPYGVPSFDWENGFTAKISKCWLCYDRLLEGKQPACVEACPTGALRFGWRDDLLAQAHAQIASNPGRYVEHIFGEHEVGGTSMLYLSDIPFAELDFPVELPDVAPREATEKVMGKLPAVIVGVGALMAGTAAYTHRDSLTRGQTKQSSTEAPGLPEEQEEEG